MSVLHYFYFHEYVTESLDTNFPRRMLHGRQPPGLLEYFLRNVHAHIPEDLCNL